MVKAVLPVIALALSFSGMAFADDSTSGDTKTSMKVEQAADKKNKVDGDIDQEITNAKLRAESGSKSKFSLSYDPAYTGGTINQAFGTKRPALSGEAGQQTFTSLDMVLNGRYRLTKNDSFTLGTAFGFVTPFQGRVAHGGDGKKVDALNVNDPTIGYNRVSKIWGLQTVASLTYQYGTSINSRSADVTHEPAITFNAMKAFQNGVSVGASVALSYTAFTSKPGQGKNDMAPGYYGGDDRSQYDLGFYPQAEYAFSDKISARTVFGYFNWKHLYGDNNHYRLLQTYVYQSIGVGYALARDIYLYPNVQFIPNDIRSDRTNFALSATINIF